MGIQGAIGSKIQGLGPAPETKLKKGGESVRGEFADRLKGALKSEVSKLPISENGPIQFKFSNHALERMQSRGLSFSPEELQRIDGAITKAGEKGAKETLVITDNSALIVNVENKTVVTAMDREMLRENIFTNIDAAVIV